MCVCLVRDKLLSRRGADTIGGYNIRERNKDFLCKDRHKLIGFQL